MKFTPSHRPYWFVDIKWIVGILLFVTLTFCLLLFTAARMTDQQNGPKIVAFTIGALVVQTDNNSDLRQQVQQALQRGKTTFQPTEGFPAVTISKADLQLSLEDLKQKLFTPIAETIYTDGVDGAAKKLFKNPKDQVQFADQASALKVISPETHDNIARFQTLLAVPVIILTLLLIYFSAGWGRLFSPGLVFVLASFPGALIATSAVSNNTSLSQTLSTQLTDALSGGYGLVFRVGLTLIALALVGKIVTFIVGRSRNKRKPSEPTPEKLPPAPEKPAAPEKPVAK